MIFQQFGDNLLFSANWRQNLISGGQGGEKSAQVFAVIGGQRSSLGYRLLATRSATTMFLMTIFGSIKGNKLVYDALLQTLGLESYFRYDNHRKQRKNYVWSKMVDFMCNHSEINFPKSREFVGTEQGRLPNGHCAHQGQGLQQTVSLGSRPSNLSSWVF